MSSMFTHSLRGAGIAALLCSQAVQAQQPSAPDVQAQLRELQRQLAEQRILIETMARRLDTRVSVPSGQALTGDELDRERGTGNGAIAEWPDVPGAQEGTGNGDVADRPGVPGAQQGTGNRDAADRPGPPGAQQGTGNRDAADRRGAPGAQQSTGNRDAADRPGPPGAQQSTGNRDAADRPGPPIAQQETGNLDVADRPNTPGAQLRAGAGANAGLPRAPGAQLRARGGAIADLPGAPGAQQTTRNGDVSGRPTEPGMQRGAGDSAGTERTGTQSARAASDLGRSGAVDAFSTSPARQAVAILASTATGTTTAANRCQDPSTSSRNAQHNNGEGANGERAKGDRDDGNAPTKVTSTAPSGAVGCLEDSAFAGGLAAPAESSTGASRAAQVLPPPPGRLPNQTGYKLSPVQTPSIAQVPRLAKSAVAAPGNGQTSPASSATAVAQSNTSNPVGKPPASRNRPPDVAPLFEQPGVLTPAGKFVFEPSVQFGYSSSNRVALVGYTVIPALLIGLIDVREIKRNTTTATFSARTGLSNRLEVDLKLPYVYRSDATVSREIFTGTAVENVFDTKGSGVGDAEIGMRYQLNNGGPDSAFYVGSLRFKSRTGRDPFEVVTDCTQRCVGPNATGTGLPLDLPTGSGFYSLQPGLTWLFPSDPAVFFASVSYLHNLKRSNVSRTVLSGEKEFLGEIKPGDIAGFNFGMGLGLNEKASFSLGYDHSSIGRTRQNGVLVPGAVRTQLGTLLLGFSYRISDRRSVNVSVGTGVTRDTPDVTLTVRVPSTF